MVRGLNMASIDRGFWIIRDSKGFLLSLCGWCHPCFFFFISKNKSFKPTDFRIDRDLQTSFIAHKNGEAQKIIDGHDNQF